MYNCRCFKIWVRWIWLICNASKSPTMTFYLSLLLLWFSLPIYYCYAVTWAKNRFTIHELRFVDQVVKLKCFTQRGWFCSWPHQVRSPWAMKVTAAFSNLLAIKDEASIGKFMFLLQNVIANPAIHDAFHNYFNSIKIVWWYGKLCKILQCNRVSKMMSQVLFNVILIRNGGQDQADCN